MPYHRGMVRTLALLVVSFAFVLAAEAAFAEVSVPSVLSDGMVLQRDEPAPVWGKAKPAEKITVTFAGQTKTTRAGSKGRWRVDLDPLAAGGPHELVIAGKNTITIRDVLVGEVWICSGQSNMQWSVRQSAHPQREIDAANHPKLRLLQVPRGTEPTPQDDFEGAWVACSPKTVANFSAVAYHFGRRLHEALDVPVGLIHTSYGGTPAEAWMDTATLKKTKALKPLRLRWERAVAAASKQGRAGDRTVFSPHRPGNLWHAMVLPLAPYRIRGVIWYQGESNAGRAVQYRTLFPTMIEAWRRHWDQGDFPFYFVQLANWRALPETPGPSAWAELREAQALTLRKVPNTGMALAIDIGEANDIHPKNKQDVGKRLAALALTRDYATPVPVTGPRFKSWKPGKNGSAVLSFDHATGLQTDDDDPPRAFAIAGRDKVFHWATARVDGEQIILTCPAVKKPVAIRYAWSDNPGVNLTNGDELPLAPFRTDDWPLTTEGKH